MKTRRSLARDLSGAGRLSLPRRWGSFPKASGGHQQLGAEAPSLVPLLLGGAGDKILALPPSTGREQGGHGSAGMSSLGNWVSGCLFLPLLQPQNNTKVITYLSSHWQSVITSALSPKAK